MRLARLLLVSCACALAACGEVSSQDAGHDPARALWLVRDEVGTARTRLTTLDGQEVPAESAALRATWSPAASHDGTRVCFLGRPPEGTVGLYVALRDEAQILRLDVAVDESSAPAWLPDGRIVYSVQAREACRALFVTDPAGGEARRITFGGTDATEPTVLADGRILYVGVSLADPSAPHPALFTIHPDGTGVTLFHAATPGRRYTRPREGADGTIRFLVEADGGTRVAVLDARVPDQAASFLPLREDALAAEPLADGTWVVVTAAGLGRMSADGGRTALAVPGHEAVRDVCCVGARPRPQGHLSMVREDGSRGRLLCLDARPQSTQGPVRVRLEARRDDAWKSLGEGPAEADGSFFVEVPADVPLRLAVLDEAGRVVGGNRTPFWVRPGEIRGCVGCHAPADQTPPNRRPDAARFDVVPVERWHALRRKP